MIWTNAVGAVFSATLLSASDTGATFEFPEDGATNTISLAALSPASARRACELAGYVQIPPAIATTHGMAKRDLARLNALLADGRIDTEAAQARRRRILAAFERVCREKGIETELIELLKSKL